jgi:hypothetical protein
VELEGGGAVGAPGGGLEREGEGERVEAGRVWGWRWEEAAGEEEEGASWVRGGREASECGVEVVGGRRWEGAEEEEGVRQRRRVRGEREAVEEAGAEEGVGVEARRGEEARVELPVV